jgi:energy-coupling factor transport system substrate-specific component
MRTQRLLSAAIFVLTTVAGVTAFLYPFWSPLAAADAAGNLAHAEDATLMLTVLVALSFLVLLLEVQNQAVSAKSIALLGVLVAINSVLRFADAAIPGPGGFSPIFLLIILGGYVFGARFGFLLGALTLFVSGFVTGGVGPWLPYQMFTAGWIGMTAPMCRPLVRVLESTGIRTTLAEVGVLAVFAGVWGLLFGAIMNIWFWPFIVGPADQYWQPGIGVVETVQRYALFYLVTSLAWDVLRAVGNVLLIAVVAAPVLRLLRRFHQRFDFSYQPVVQPATASAANPAPALAATVGGDV